MHVGDVWRGVRALLVCWREVPEPARVAVERTRTCANCVWLEVRGPRWTGWIARAYEWLHPPGELQQAMPWAERRNWRCRLCQCTLRIKARLPDGFIERHTPDELATRAPMWCWWRREIVFLRRR